MAAGRCGLRHRSFGAPRSEDPTCHRRVAVVSSDSFCCVCMSSTYFRWRFDPSSVGIEAIPFAEPSVESKEG